MVTSTEAASSSPAPDPLPPPSSFPILKPRSKRRPIKFPPPPPPPFPSVVVAEEEEQEQEQERPWKLRSHRSGPSTQPTLGKEHRPLFAVPLSTDEIEEDIYAVTGSRPRRRPRKRPRILQKQIDLVFPGLWLTEVTLDLYRVPDDR